MLTKNWMPQAILPPSHRAPIALSHRELSSWVAQSSELIGGHSSEPQGEVSFTGLQRVLWWAWTFTRFTVRFLMAFQLLYSFCLCWFLGPNTYNENETIAKYEIMDGAPVRGMRCKPFLLFGVFDTKSHVIRNFSRYFWHAFSDCWVSQMSAMHLLVSRQRRTCTRRKGSENTSTCFLA